MHKLFCCLLSIALLMNLPQGQAQTRKPAKTTQETIAKAPVTQSVRGAATAEELGNLVFEALHKNDPNMLDGYFPAQSDLDAMSKSKDEDVGLVMEESRPELVRSAFMEDFQALVNDAVSKNLALTNLTLSEVQPSKAAASQLQPIRLLLSDAEHPQVIILFEAIKINGRYFLFQNIGQAAQ